MGKEFYSEFAGTLFKKITHVPEFEKDLKKLVKRFSSLEDDLRMFIKVALNAYHQQKIDSNAIFHLSDLGIRSPKIFKAKKFACKALKGKGAQSGIRVIYAYHESEDWLEFVELYYKGDKENENRERILRIYLKNVHGILTSETSVTKELLRERAKDRGHEEEKLEKRGAR